MYSFVATKSKGKSIGRDILIGVSDQQYQPTLSQLRAFVAVATHRHFGTAAARLHVSQPTLSRLENEPNWRALGRIGLNLIDVACRSWARPPQAITLDIDDTDDPAHGQQELSIGHAPALQARLHETPGIQLEAGERAREPERDVEVAVIHRPRLDRDDDGAAAPLGAPEPRHAPDHEEAQHRRNAL